ncbi:MAG: hypothetical protein LUG91_09040 [Ruminococcus sp.]|nr:hypothetical protein [Ruminococcus sp.]
MSDIEVELIKCPTLPKTIQGDGRYVMSLLAAYLEQVSTQVNLANKFSAEEIEPDTNTNTNALATPNNFYLSFGRTGGTLTWTHLEDISGLAYYELRADTHVGEEIGLLERTASNTSTALPVDRVATVYLYAVNRDGVASAATAITYTKAYPDAPNNISIAGSSDGALVTFTAIPNNCIGANIYIGSEQHQSLSNVFLYTGTAEINNVEVAYYDQFGEGERSYLSLDLPDVTGLLVERNGADLDFYWDPVDYYGISYVVKVCGTSPDWIAGTELFRTKTNDKNRYIYPNTGKYYLMVKAMDENGNYSKNAAWQVMDNTTLEIGRNIILAFDQEEVGYSGVKNNLYYDANLGGITLDRDATRAEYIMDIELDQEYKARNWCDYQALSVTGNDMIWDDADYTWDEAETTAWAGMIGNTDGVTVSQQLAYYTGSNTETLFNALLDGDLLTANGEEPTVAINADDFETGRWHQGLYINQMTQLEYSVDMTQQFYMMFHLKTNAKLKDTNIITLADDSGTAYLYLGYDSGRGLFYLKASDAVTIWADDVTGKERDWICFGISQGSNTRTLYIYSWQNDSYTSVSAEAEPAGIFTTLYCYPKSGNDMIWDDADYTWDEAETSWARAFISWEQPGQDELRACEAVLSDIHIEYGDMDVDEFFELVNTPSNYTQFTEFKVGEYEYKKALVRLLVQASVLQSEPSISGVTMYVDIPDTDDHGTVVIKDATAATKVYYNKFYYNAPEVGVMVIGGNTTGGLLTPHLITTSGNDGNGRYFEVEILDSGAVRTTGTISWISKGY